MSADFHRPGFDLPPCPTCSHPFHGAPCRRFDTTTPGRMGEPCECPTAFRSEEIA